MIARDANSASLTQARSKRSFAIFGKGSQLTRIPEDSANRFGAISRAYGATALMTIE